MSKPARKWLVRSLPTEVLSSFFRRLQAMTSAGIPLHQALNFLSIEENAMLREALEQVVHKVHSGVMLSRALREHPNVFPALACDLIHAGETTGKLDRVLSDLADYLERTTRLQKKLISALTYPALLMGLTFVIVGVLVVFVFPREAEMATSLGAEVPALTSWLISAAKIVGHPATVILALVLLVTAVVIWPTVGKPIYERTLRKFVDERVLDIPVVGQVLAKSAYARMLGAQASLLSAGMGMGPSMNVIGALSQNRDVERRFKEFISEVTQGVPMGEAAEKVYPPVVCAMFRIGEEQGQLDTLLERTALMYEEEVEASLVTMTALLEPLALLFMGLVVGTVVIATSLPTMQLLQRL